MEVNFQLTTGQKAIFECLQAAHAQNFLLAIPIEGLCQHMSKAVSKWILQQLYIECKLHPLSISGSLSCICISISLHASKNLEDRMS
jgi:hypothetical protein